MHGRSFRAASFLVIFTIQAAILPSGSAQAPGNQFARSNLAGGISSLELLLQPSQQNSTEVPLWGLFETSITNPKPYSDPFDFGVIELQAVFTSPTGNVTNWWGFFDGDGEGGQAGNIWKLRFMPEELGTWQYSWQFSDGSVQGSGAFTAVDSGLVSRKPGPLKRDDLIPQWFVTADESRHIFPNMYNEWRATDNLPYTNPGPAISTVKAHGFDVMAVWSTAYFRNEPMDNTNPMIWIDTHTYTPRLEGWHLLENGLYQEAYEEEVYLYEWDGFYSGNGLYDLHSRPDSFRQNVLKYWLARTAPYYMFLFNIGFELPEYSNVPEWPVAEAEFIKSNDPWNHMITAHELHGWSYGDSPIIDFSALQNDNLFHERGLAVWKSPSKSHPHCSECIWNAPWQPLGTEESHRRDLWDGITAGMSNFLYARDSAIGLDAFRHANIFMSSGVAWWTMSPHDELIIAGTGYALARPGTEYVVYSASADSVTVQVPSGNYQWVWFNPATAAYSSVSQLAHAGGPAEFQKPNANDWVLHISVSSSATPVPSPTPTPSPTATSFMTASPSATLTATTAPSLTPTSTATSTPPPASTSTPTPSYTATPSPSSKGPTSTSLPTATASPTATDVPGDINGDGQVNVLDTQLCVNVFLGVETDPEVVAGADVNSDGVSNVLDVQMIVNIYLSD